MYGVGVAGPYLRSGEYFHDNNLYKEHAKIPQ
jgi:hypothetical protein